MFQRQKQCTALYRVATLTTVEKPGLTCQLFCWRLLIVLKCIRWCYPAPSLFGRKDLHNERGILVSKETPQSTWIVVILVIGGMLLAVLWPSLIAAISGDSSSAEVSGSSGVMLQLSDT